MLTRILEELLECNNARKEEHIFEEAIDFLNYSWSLPLLFLDATDPEIRSENKAFGYFLEAVHRGFNHDMDGPKNLDVVQRIIYVTNSMFPLMEKLRNRPWMYGQQSSYFDGWLELCLLVQDCTKVCLDIFGRDFETFIDYFIAKNLVLRYRLDSSY